MTSKALKNQRPVKRGGVWAEIDERQAAFDSELANAKTTAKDIGFTVEVSHVGKWFGQPKFLRGALARLGPFDTSAMREAKKP